MFEETSGTQSVACDIRITTSRTAPIYDLAWTAADSGGPILIGFELDEANGITLLITREAAAKLAKELAAVESA